jgi:hypothetical protein
MTRALYDYNGDGLSDITWYFFEPDGIERDDQGFVRIAHVAHWLSSGGEWAWSYTGFIAEGWENVGTGLHGAQDGGVDLLFQHATTGEVGFWDMAGGTVAGWTSLGFANGFQAVGTHDTDFDGDGYDDVLLIDRFSGQMGFWSVRDGAVTGWTTLGYADSYQEFGDFWDVMGAADFSGDGLADLFWYNFDTRQSGLWVTAAEGAQWVGLPTAAENWSPAFLDGDLTGDDVGDILWTYYDGGPTTSIGYWDVSAGGAEWHYIGEATANWAVISMGDYTGDGVDDILLRDQTTGAVGYWEFDAGGVYAGWAWVGQEEIGDQWSVVG